MKSVLTVVSGLPLLPRSDRLTEANATDELLSTEDGEKIKYMETVPVGNRQRMFREGNQENQAKRNTFKLNFSKKR